MRKENRRLLEEENNKIFEQLRQERQEKLRRAAAASVASNNESTRTPRTPPSSGHSSVRIKVTWPASESARLSREFLETLFTNKYGSVENLVVGAKASKPSALLEFKSRHDAVKCLRDERALKDEYSIQLKCLDDLDLLVSRVEVGDDGESDRGSGRNDGGVVDGAETGDHNQPSSESFEDLEARILKKMRATKNV